MRSRSRVSSISPAAPRLHLKGDQEHSVLSEGLATPSDNVKSRPDMAQVNGHIRPQSPPLPPQEPQRINTGRVASMTRSGTISNAKATSDTDPRQAGFASPADGSPSIGSPQWSSAIGHASTGKSGRVIERLQADIDRLHREQHLLKMRHDEAEKANETLTTRTQYLQDRNSNYEQSHEANLRQLARKERQVDDLREELKREKERTSRAEEQARVANSTEEEWRDQASQAKAVAQQREVEYETIVSCRNRDNERHQNGLDKIRSSFETLLRERQEDAEKQKKLEIIAEQQRQTIAQLEELTKKMTANFKTYRMEIDTAIKDLKDSTKDNDMALKQRLQEMQETTGRMKWVMNVDEIINHSPPRAPPQPTRIAPSVPDLMTNLKNISVDSLQEQSSRTPTKSPSRTRPVSEGKERNRLRKQSRSGR